MQLQKRTIAFKLPTDLPSIALPTAAAAQQTPEAVFTIGSASTLTPLQHTLASGSATSLMTATPANQETPADELSTRKTVDGYGHEEGGVETFITMAEILSHRLSAEGELSAVVVVSYCH